jgi:hypothetical protein
MASHQSPGDLPAAYLRASPQHVRSLKCLISLVPQEGLDLYE